MPFQYHGGTNFGRTAGGPYITTSYDYDAPLDEFGNNTSNFSFYDLFYYFFFACINCIKKLLLLLLLLLYII